MRQIFVRSLLALALVAPFPTTGAPAAPPDLLAFDELMALYEEEPPSKALAAKLDALRRTPFVDNSAWERGARPRKPDVAGLGPVLRVAQWNIERGLELAIQASARHQSDAIGAMPVHDGIEAVHVRIAARRLEALVEELLLDSLHGGRKQARVESLLEGPAVDLELG